MPAGKCSLELYLGRRWLLAAEVRCDDVREGFRGSARCEYDYDYLDGQPELDRRDLRAVSCRYPTSYADHEESHWPAFLLDLIPSGAARRYWESQLGLPNNSSSDWPVLVAGGGNPPGNVRVAEAAAHIVAVDHPGFEREELLARGADFIEYARAHGASIAGGTGAAGDAPKFLLREDSNGRWHADGALSDDRTVASWLVKFPRSPAHSADRRVLEAEAGYYRLAATFGARVHGPLAWERDCLFVPRFDRPKDGDRIARLGLESLCSLCGVTDFGEPIAKEVQASAIAAFTTDPAVELREFVLRDVLDVALGNTDNHARNTAVLKHEDGRIELSPLYDFAPMVLDPQGIARVSRWAPGVEEDGYPNWQRVVDAVARHGVDTTATKRLLAEVAGPVADLPRSMADAGVPRDVIDKLSARTARVARALEAVRR